MQVDGLRLRPVEELALHAIEESSLPAQAAEVIASTRSLYRRNGFAPPWIGYLAFEGNTCVGTCAFTGAPRDGEVEIAYFTFPGNEGRGVATRMAAELLRIARAHPAAGICVIAHTLPEENASTTILRRLGFDWLGVIDHPEDGTVWKWRERAPCHAPALPST